MDNSVITRGEIEYERTIAALEKIVDGQKTEIKKLQTENDATLSELRKKLQTENDATLSELRKKLASKCEQLDDAAENLTEAETVNAVLKEEAKKLNERNDKKKISSDAGVDDKKKKKGAKEAEEKGFRLLHGGLE